MTKNPQKTQRLHVSIPFFSAVSAFVFIFLLVRSDIAIEYMRKGLKLCAATVIPSLFPFMVISELLVQSGLASMIGKPISKPFRYLFGVSEGGACAFVLGIVCGFPIGAKTLCAMLDRGEIPKSEAERALTFCNNPGSAFIISAVGASLFGSFTLGIALYVCVILSAIIVGIAGRFLIKNEQNESSFRQNSIISPARKGGIETFISAIQSSASSMLTVCALVAFFSSIVGCLGALLDTVGAPMSLTAAIFGFFELSSGVGMAAELSPMAAILLCAAFCGWSGMSVHLQVMTVCSGRGFSFKPYIIAKIAQGTISAALMCIALKLLPFSEDVFAEISTSLKMNSGYSNAAFVCCVFFAAALFGTFSQLFCQKGSKNRDKNNF